MAFPYLADKLNIHLCGRLELCDMSSADTVTVYTKIIHGRGRKIAK
jgi:hypothetical protein